MKSFVPACFITSGHSVQKWKGMIWNQPEWNGMEWNRMEWNGMERN